MGNPKPWEVRFLTTEAGKLRLHPQLYADGHPDICQVLGFRVLGFKGFRV